MQRRGLLIFVFLNVLISAGVAFGIISTQGGSSGTPSERLVTFVVVVTATNDPNATPAVRIITATPGPNDPARAQIPAELLPGTAQNQAFATLDPTALGANPVLQAAATNLPANCIPHVVDSGENPSIIASIYGANLFDVLAVNGLDERSSLLLQVGDVLIIPLPGCTLEGVVTIADNPLDTPEGVDTASAGTTVTPGVRPTITLAPTAANAQVIIERVTGQGDITTEAVEIRNRGSTINLTGWTLSDGDGNTFVFPSERILFSNGTLTINTRTGQNTPIVLYWGLDQAAFQPGDVVILADANGVVQASLRLPTAQNLGG